jgi:hypothetical protein
MALTLLLLWLTTWLLCWTYITTSSRPENILTRRTLLHSVLLSLGVVFALCVITVLAAKIFLWIMIPEFVQILETFLLEVLRNRNYGLIQTFTGIAL